MTRDDRIQKIIADIKDTSLCLTDPKEWARQEAIRELRREDPESKERIREERNNDIRKTSTMGNG